MAPDKTAAPARLFHIFVIIMVIVIFIPGATLRAHMPYALRGSAPPTVPDINVIGPVIIIAPPGRRPTVTAAPGPPVACPIVTTIIISRTGVLFPAEIIFTIKIKSCTAGAALPVPEIAITVIAVIIIVIVAVVSHLNPVMQGQ